MAFRTQKISQMTPKGSDLEATDLLEVSTIESGSYVTRSITGQEIIDAAVGNVDWGDIGGTLSDQTDLNTALSGKVPTTRTLTINGTTQDLSADRTFTISTGITIGTTAIASGTVGRVLFDGTGNVVQESANLTYDNTNLIFTLGSTATRILTFRPQDTTGAYGNSCSIRGGNGNGRLDFYSGSNITELRDNIIILTSVGGPSVQVGASSISLSVGGSTRLQVAPTTGNVLINTTTDAGYRLDVNGTARLNASSGNDIITDSTNVTVNGYAVGGSLIRFQSRNAAAALVYKFVVPNNNDTAGYFTGNVGIGTSSPAYVLDVVGGFRIGSSTIKLGMGESGGNSVFVGSLTNQPLKFLVNTNEYARIATTGNVLINTTTDAGFKLDVNGTVRVADNNQLGWGNGNYLIANNATPKIDCYVQSSLILTIGQTLFTIAVASRTRDISPNADNSFDIGSQFGRYRNGWFGAKLKVGDATAFDASAKLQVDSTTLGFLPPRMTTTQKNAIATPAAGLMVYDTTLNLMSVYNGTTWITL